MSSNAVCVIGALSPEMKQPGVKLTTRINLVVMNVCGAVPPLSHAVTCALKCITFINISFWGSGFEVRRSTAVLKQDTFWNLTPVSKVNLWKYLEIVQHNSENQKSALSHFCPEVEM
jgi:hypothetical protein